jgi:hypothetical protein
MTAPPKRVLIVDDAVNTLSRTLEPYLGAREVELARDTFDVVYAIETALEPYDALFCDLGRTDLPAWTLWAYLADGRANAADRMVFVASGRLSDEAKEFLDRVPNTVLDLTADGSVLEHLARRRSLGAGVRPSEVASDARGPGDGVTRPGDLVAQLGSAVTH